MGFVLFCLQTRAEIQAIKERLDTGLAALASTVTGNPAYAAQQLDDLKPLVLPLLASPIVGEGSAYDAAYALARCLPGALHDAAFAVASALQMVMQSQLDGRPRTLPVTLWLTYLALMPSTGVSYQQCSLVAALALLERTHYHDAAVVGFFQHARASFSCPQLPTPCIAARSHAAMHGETNHNGQ